MERVGTLINKLKEQFDQQADPDKLTITAQLILSELSFKKNNEPLKGNVSVVMPMVHVVQSSAEIMTNLIDADRTCLPISEKELEIKKIPSGWLFEDSVEIPTLSFQTIPAEPIKQAFAMDFVNEIIPLNEQFQLDSIPEINDHLREESQEVVTKLDETPIRDLRKAISVNDKYLFAHVLFRGDESMYERSIKTINNFSIYPEAQYWIQRELKVKLGWEDTNKAVKLFDQLVKRRFS